jgi:hypothetical protein
MYTRLHIRNPSLLKTSLCATKLNTIYGKNPFIVPTDAHNNIKPKLQNNLKNYNTRPDMFRLIQEPSSGSRPVLG